MGLENWFYGTIYSILAQNIATNYSWASKCNVFKCIVCGVL